MCALLSDLQLSSSESDHLINASFAASDQQLLLQLLQVKLSMA